MATVIPNTSNQEANLLRFISSLQDRRTREKISERQSALQAEYQSIYKKQVEFATSKGAEALRETQREINVAKARGDKATAAELELRLEALNQKKKEGTLDQFILSAEILKNMRSENYALKQQTAAQQEQMNMFKLQMQWQDNKRKSIQGEVNAILAPSSGLAAEDALAHGTEMRRLLSAEKPDPNALMSLRERIGESRKLELDRRLKSTEAQKQRDSQTKMQETRETAGTKYKLDEKDYDPGSFDEITVARANYQKEPEVRMIHTENYPSVYANILKSASAGGRLAAWATHKESKFLYTESRARALGLHDEWVKAKPGSDVEENVPSKEEFHKTLNSLTNPDRARMYYDQWYQKVYK